MPKQMKQYAGMVAGLRTYRLVPVPEGQGRPRGKVTPQRLVGLNTDDIFYFHSLGAHGNYYPDEIRFNEELFREDCPGCQAKLFVACMKDEVQLGTD